MGKVMYLVTQSVGYYEDSRTNMLFLTEDLDKAIEFKKKEDLDCELDTIVSPMTYKVFKELNEGYPEGWNEEEYYDSEEANNPYNVGREPAVDRGGYSAEDFLEMREKVDNLAYDPTFPCMIYEFKVDEPDSARLINIKRDGKR